MGLWGRIKAALLDQRGEFDFGSLGDLFGGGATGGGDWLSNLGGGGFSGFNLSPGQATSLGPVGGGTGFDFGSVLGNLSGYANEALPFLRLGTGALGAYSGIQGMINAGKQQNYLNTAQKNLQGAAAPGLAAGQQLIPAGTQALMGGALPPELEATVTNWSNAEKAKMRQAYAHMGITDSTMFVQADAAVDAQAQQLRAQLAQGLLTGGQGAIGGAIQASGQGGALAANQQNSVAQALQQADAAMARLLGGSA